MALARIFTYWKQSGNANLYEIDNTGTLTGPLYSRPVFWNQPQHVSAAYDSQSLLLTSSIHTNPSWPTGVTHRIDLLGNLLNVYDLGVSNLGIYSAFQYDANSILAFVADLTGGTWHFYAYILDVATGATISVTNLDAVYLTWVSFPGRLAFFGGYAFFFDQQVSPTPSTLYKLELATGVLTAVSVVSPGEYFDSVSSPASGSSLVTFRDQGSGAHSTIELWKVDQSANAAPATTINAPYSPTLGSYFRYHSVGHDDGSFLWLVTEDAFDFNLYQINENDYSGSASPLIVVSSSGVNTFNASFAFIGGDIVIPGATGGWCVGSIRIG